jgi:dihydroxy-acid dehydratase
MLSCRLNIQRCIQNGSRGNNRLQSLRTFATLTPSSSSSSTPTSSTSSSKPTLNKYSQIITQNDAHSGAQSMLYATGLKEEDMNKAQVGIASVWWEGNPCNMHLNQLGDAVSKGVKKAGGMVGMRFNTIGVSDAISMGTDGMSYSLPSRDIIADSIETVMGAQWYDGLITLPGCDKNMPGIES